MTLIVIILLVSFILTPLIELTANERVRFFSKLLIYLLTAIYVLYVLVTGKMVL